jgi:hypothetical protein
LAGGEEWFFFYGTYLLAVLLEYSSAATHYSLLDMELFKVKRPKE